MQQNVVRFLGREQSGLCKEAFDLNKALSRPHVDYFAKLLNVFCTEVIRLGKTCASKKKSMVQF